jgi:hypothetical protein
VFALVTQLFAVNLMDDTLNAVACRAIQKQQKDAAMLAGQVDSEDLDWRYTCCPVSSLLLGDSKRLII